MDEFIAGLYPSMFEAGRPVKEAPDRRSPRRRRKAVGDKHECWVIAELAGRQTCG